VSELTAKDALVSLFDSAASPLEVADLERVAEVVVQWHHRFRLQNRRD